MKKTLTAPMLTQIALAYLLTWLLALCGAGVVEVVRLFSTGKVAPMLDWVGFLCFAWLTAPVAAPVWALMAMRGWARRR